MDKLSELTGLPASTISGIGLRVPRGISIPLLLGTILAFCLSKQAAADCIASSGTIDDIAEDGVVVTCDVEDPNPFTSGIGTTTTNTNLTVDVEADAEIASTGVGVNLGDDGALNNQGIIRASLEAVGDTSVDGSGSVDVDNDGSIISSAGVAVDLGLDDANVDSSGTISGLLGGIRIGDGRVLNSGSITSSDVDSVGIELGVGGTLDNTGTLVSSGVGVLSGAGGLVTNSGSITGSSTSLILGAGAALENSGSVVSETGTAIFAGGSTSLVNNGLVEGAGFAIELRGGGNTLTLDSGSDLVGDVLAVSAVPTDSLILTGSATEDSDFSNFETLIMRGDQWTLSGAVQAAEATLETGRLNVNGLLDTRVAGLPGILRVQSGTLSGSGTIIGGLENTGGTLRLGRETLTLTGSYQQTEGGTLRVGDGTGGIGRLLVSGTADLSGELVVASGSDTVADVLTADGGITGDFSSVRTDGRAQVAVSVGSNSIRLIRASTSVQDSQLDAALDNVYLTLDSLTPGAAEPPEGGLWARALGHYGDRNERDELPGGDWWISGVMVGGDVRLGPGLRLGAALGYTRTELDADDGSEVDADNLVYGAYLEIPGDRFWGRMAIAGGSADNEQSRVLLLEDSEVKTQAVFDGSSFAFRAGFGGRFGFEPFVTDDGSGWLFEPSILLDYVVLDQDPYSETGGSELSYATEEDVESLQLSGLLTVRRPFLATSTFSPRFYAGVVHRAALDDRAWTASDPTSDLLLALEGDDQSTTNLGVGAGTDFRLGQRFTGFLDWRGEIGKYKNRHLVTLGIRVRL